MILMDETGIASFVEIYNRELKNHDEVHDDDVC